LELTADKLPPLPPVILVPELVCGEAKQAVDGDPVSFRLHRDARAATAVAHRTRLETMAREQGKQVDLTDDLVDSVRDNLRGTGRQGRQVQHVLVAELLQFFELMAAYIKRELSLCSQVVYAHITPVSVIGVSVKMKVAVRRKAKPALVALKVVNRSHMRVSGGFALICYMVHLKDPFFLFLLELFSSGTRVLV